MPRKKKAEESSAPSKPSTKTKRPATKKTAAKSTNTTKKMAVPKSPKTVSPQKAPARAKSVGTASRPEPASWKKTPRQGETQMVAFIRDPHCLFTYWEVTPQRIEEVKRELMEEYRHSTMVLRVLRTGPDGQAELIQEIRVEPGEMNRYVELKEGVAGGFFLEIAQKAPSGRTIVYARSNKIMAGTGPGFQGAEAGSGGASWEMPAGLAEYFSETEEGGTRATVRGLSSAEAHRRAAPRGRLDRYAASRTN